LRLTPEGETWLPYATQMLDTLQAGLQKIRPRMTKFAGRCKLPCRPTWGVTCC
jgi:DNA-binding transcriptional LysR family regulator